MISINSSDKTLLSVPRDPIEKCVCVCVLFVVFV